MTMISMNPIGRCEARIDALRAELGAVMAARIFEAEAADFLWESRVRERYLGQHFDGFATGEDAFEDVSRVAVLSILDGQCHAGICVIDGEGCVVDGLWSRAFSSFEEAEFAFLHAR